VGGGAEPAPLELPAGDGPTVDLVSWGLVGSYSFMVRLLYAIIHAESPNCSFEAREDEL
jgi:hypothetical protein